LGAAHCYEPPKTTKNHKNESTRSHNHNSDCPSHSDSTPHASLNASADRPSGRVRRGRDCGGVRVDGCSLSGAVSCSYCFASRKRSTVLCRIASMGCVCPALRLSLARPFPYLRFCLLPALLDRLRLTSSPSDHFALVLLIFQWHCDVCSVCWVQPPLCCALDCSSVTSSSTSPPRPLCMCRAETAPLCCPSERCTRCTL